MWPTFAGARVKRNEELSTLRVFSGVEGIINMMVEIPSCTPKKIFQALSLQLPWSYVPGKPSLSSRSEAKFTKHKKLVTGFHEISIDLLYTSFYTMTCLDVATIWHHKTLPTGSQFWLQDSPSLGMMTVSARNKRPRPLDRWSCACADMIWLMQMMPSRALTYSLLPAYI